jgi:hypothetical protein
MMVLFNSKNELKGWYVMPSLDGLIDQMLRKKGLLDVKTFQESQTLKIGQ